MGHEALRVRSFYFKNGGKVNKINYFDEDNSGRPKHYLKFKVMCKVEWRSITDENGKTIKITDSEINYLELR